MKNSTGESGTMPQHAFDQIVGERSDQQDKIAVKQGSDGQLLALVADGMGGEKAGALASHTAIESFLKTFDCDIGADAVERRLKEGLQRANDDIAALVENSPDLKGMGTTFVASYIESNRLYWISVGDSLLLIHRDGDLKRLNADHSFQVVLDAQLEAGDLSIESAAQDPRKSQLLSALCGETVPYVDYRFTPFQLREGDVIISASDGILSMPLEDINSLLNKLPKRSPEQIVKQIMQSVVALKHSWQDNTSIIAQTI